MRVQDFLKLVGRPGRENYLAVCPDDMGLGLLLQGALAPVAVPEDIQFHSAESITKEKARQIEVDARFAPRGGSALNHFFIYSLQSLPTDSVGPLLKSVEEAKYSRFIFQAQSVPRAIKTLMSRSNVCRLPFLSRKMVLGNMKALNHDARTADQLNLYDGTLAGTIRALSAKDTIAEIQRELKRGPRGLTALFNPDILNSVAFEQATQDLLTDKERAFLRGGKRFKDQYEARQKLLLYRITQRMGEGAAP